MATIIPRRQFLAGAAAGAGLTAAKTAEASFKAADPTKFSRQLFNMGMKVEKKSPADKFADSILRPSNFPKGVINIANMFLKDAKSPDKASKGNSYVFYSKANEESFKKFLLQVGIPKEALPQMVNMVANSPYSAIAAQTGDGKGDFDTYTFINTDKVVSPAAISGLIAENISTKNFTLAETQDPKTHIAITGQARALAKRTAARLEKEYGADHEVVLFLKHNIDEYFENKLKAMAKAAEARKQKEQKAPPEPVPDPNTHVPPVEKSADDKPIKPGIKDASETKETKDADPRETQKESKPKRKRPLGKINPAHVAGTKFQRLPQRSKSLVKLA